MKAKTKRKMQTALNKIWGALDEITDDDAANDDELYLIVSHLSSVAWTMERYLENLK